jgi:hypothetical protein
MAMETTAVAALGLVIAIGVLLSNLLRVKIDPREPPVIHPTVPLLGHIIGLLKEGPRFFRRVK